MSGDGMVWLLVAGGAVVAVTLAVAVRLVIRLARARRLLGEAGVPVSGKVTFWAAVAYLVFPVDLLPDPVLLDDIGFLLLALRSLHKAAAGLPGKAVAGLPGGAEGPFGRAAAGLPEDAARKGVRTRRGVQS
ncbi:YkvA family protein [Streptomyces pathocidini]|uniref:YkvA family protein n=1 Tax=Streptomyces pathocidini TaxID=1650571 RepID=UPI0034060402